jgi:hypothetical protein
MLNGIFSRNKTVDVEIQPRTQSITNGVLGPVTYTTNKTVKGIFWRGSMAQAVVNEKYKTEVDGVVIVKPGIAIADTDRVKIGTVQYSVIYADDIAGQGKVLMIPVKKV